MVLINGYPSVSLQKTLTNKNLHEGKEAFFDLLSEGKGTFMRRNMDHVVWTDANGQKLGSSLENKSLDK